MLYDRDFNILTEEEIIKLKIAEEYLKKNTANSGINVSALYNYHNMRPDASYYYESLFPNNYLFSKSLDNKDYLKKMELEFKALIDSDISERQILNFINGNKYYNLIAAIFNTGYSFGHHDAYLFKEFEITSTFKADYLLIGKNSHGYHFIFIELENSNGSITTQNGDFGQTIRKGIKQVEEWDKWLEGNFHTLSLIFDKFKTKLSELPKEFRVLNKSRLQYVVVAGRRSDFNENTYEEKRRLLRSKHINLLHYDNIIDSFRSFYSASSY